MLIPDQKVDKNRAKPAYMVFVKIFGRYFYRESILICVNIIGVRKELDITRKGMVTYMEKYFSKKIASAAASVMIAASLLLTGCQSSTNTAVDTASAETEEATAASSDETEATESETDSGAASTPVGYYGEMVVRGNEIVGSKTDNYVQVAGMSLFWSNWSQSFYTADRVNTLVDEYNCEVVRASYGVQENGVPYDESDVERIKSVVQAAIDKGIYVILDWHSHGAHNNPDEAIEFFSMMAEEYGSYDNVIFELYNEPKQVSWQIVKEYAEKVVPEIRKYSDNLIIVGSPTWSQDVDKASLDPVEGENIAYTLHFYAGTHKKSLRDKADKALNNGIALFVTEWGSVDSSGNGAIDYNSTAEWINWMNEKHISWCNWAVNDKDESSSIYDTDGNYTEAGNLLKELIASSSQSAEWKTGEIKAKENCSLDKAEFTVVTKPREIIVHELPGKVEAEDYSEMSGIQTEGCGEGGKDVGYIETGDFVSYSVNVSETGKYTVSFRVASTSDGGVIKLISAENELASVEVPNTGDWQNWETVTADVELEAGTSELKIEVPQGGYNINWLEFELSTAA